MYKKRIILSVLACLFISFPSIITLADMGPKPTMNFTLNYEISEKIELEGGEQYQCEDVNCKEGAPLLDYGPQRFSCSGNHQCSSLAYGYKPYQKLVLNFSDKTRESQVFQPQEFDAKFDVKVTDSGLIVTEEALTDFYTREVQFFEDLIESVYRTKDLTPSKIDPIKIYLAQIKEGLKPEELELLKEKFDAAEKYLNELEEKGLPPITIKDEPQKSEASPIISKGEFLAFIRALIITLLVELLIAWTFLSFYKIPKKVLLYVLIANVLSLPVVWFLFPLLQTIILPFTAFVLSEIFAVIFETYFIYYLNKSVMSLKKVFIMCLIMNFISLAIGEFIYPLF